VHVKKSNRFKSELIYKGYTVLYVIDGDYIVVMGILVRMIGVGSLFFYM